MHKKSNFGPANRCQQNHFCLSEAAVRGGARSVWQFLLPPKRLMAGLEKNSLVRYTYESLRDRVESWGKVQEDLPEGISIYTRRMSSIFLTEQTMLE